MGKSIFTYYKERLIEIGGKNKCLYLKSIVRRGAYDIGKLFEGRDSKVSELIEFLWSGTTDSLTLITSKERDDIAENIGLPDRSKALPETARLTIEEAENAYAKYKKQLSQDTARILEGEISKVKELKREVEEIEKETGRYELYIGYPFVFGSINQGPSKTLIKAPLLLFPVKIEIGDDDTVEIRRNGAEKIQLNRALIFAYAQSKHLDIEELELEFDDLSAFKNVKAVVDYLKEKKIRIDCQGSKTVYNYSRFKEPDGRGELSIRHAAVLARLSLSNSIYTDYTLLEKKNLTNDAIAELLRNHKKNKTVAQKKRDKRRLAKRAKRRVGTGSTYAVKMLDYSQSEVIRKVDEMGNMVIYGPPGTGKSQTIVNIITDAIAKNKRVLVVSQKKAALDVVYSRLGTLNAKAMYLSDESKEKRAFYDRCFTAHQRDEVESLVDVEGLQREYDALEEKINREVATLDGIQHLLTDIRPFGLSLAQMYRSSYILSKNSSDYAVYLAMLENKSMMLLRYKDISEALFAIKAKNLGEMYYKFVEVKDKNPIIDMMLPDLDISTLSEVKAILENTQKSRRGYFNISKYPYTRQVLAHYSRLDNPRNIKTIVKTECKLENPGAVFLGKREAQLEEKFLETLIAIEEFAAPYNSLKRVMTKEGYISVIDNLLRGNNSYIKHVYEALDNYIELRDLSRLVDGLDKNMLTILNFAYSVGKSYQHYLEIIDKFLVYRIYHELTRYEEECKDGLAKMLDFSNITARIYKMKGEQLKVANKLCAGKNSLEYRNLYENGDDAKDFLYQISKDQKLWPIRKTMELYSDYVLALFPCWLLSPENVSAILPLEKNLFDIVIFDEASQVFIESTIPTIYRGKNIVVAGDSKQLRPSATFMKRYMGADPESQDDLAVQAALEVESLLDLAVARYESANLTYHYRSRHEELINFSNSAFYSSNLQIAPNISPNRNERPIERYKVAGVWQERTNPVEAKKVVEILKNIFKTRKAGESIGIITFNSDQQSCIADAIDREARRDQEFRDYVTKERYRIDGGEDTGLFIKNLENVQGDERDIIIFSIGYAKNADGRVYTNFGSLSAEGGENRLNVAITRAKSKIIVVTSIEPEELKVDTAKNEGPKLLREYLTYVRAVADGDTEQVRAVLSRLDPVEQKAGSINPASPEIELQIKDRLEKLGYKVHLQLGNRNSRISLAIYDEELDRYLVGIELDKDAFLSSSSSMERDVYKPKFLEARGWNIMRVWCRDWWLSPTRVIKSIAAAADKAKAELKAAKASARAK